MMKHNTKTESLTFKKAFLGLVVAALLAFGMVASVFSSEALAQTTTPSKDVVDIELDVMTPQGSTVKLGDDNGRIYEVRNIGDEAYVRLVPTFEHEGETFAKHAVELGSGWIQAPDGYYYYTKPMTTNSKQDIPANIIIDGTEPFLVDLKPGDAIAFTEGVTAEAIQTKDMYPNWESDEPWEGAYKGSYEPSSDVVYRDVISPSGQPQTGDTTDVMPWVILGAIALLVLLMAEMRLKLNKISESKSANKNENNMI